MTHALRAAALAAVLAVGGCRDALDADGAAFAARLLAGARPASAWFEARATAHAADGAAFRLRLEGGATGVLLLVDARFHEVPRAGRTYDASAVASLDGAAWKPDGGASWRVPPGAPLRLELAALERAPDGAWVAHGTVETVLRRAGVPDVPTVVRF
jgi:hypothetical protein